MTVTLYVATDRDGVQHADARSVAWRLPDEAGTPGAPVEPPGPFVLETASALLDDLDERIFVAVPGDGEGAPDATGMLRAASASLLGESAWDVAAAASFALDCADHVLGEAASVALPGGSTLGSAIADARDVLVRASENAEQRLGLLARLAAARRLHRTGGAIGDVAFEAVLRDTESAVVALDDPAWATVASARDAVLAAVEALRHFALPRYVAARERSYDEGRGESDVRPAPSTVWTTPWGPVTVGAEHLQGFEPAWVAARDAAVRARDAARSSRGEHAELDERAWQASRLATYLGAAGRTGR
ncbi:MAG: hypothetical protein M0Z33_04250 [Actinomycetota bacterium]|nr:hypothetical protein [Actinomycetota bacterium]